MVFAISFFRHLEIFFAKDNKRTLVIVKREYIVRIEIVNIRKYIILIFHIRYIGLLLIDMNIYSYYSNLFITAKFKKKCVN